MAIQRDQFGQAIPSVFAVGVAQSSGQDIAGKGGGTGQVSGNLTAYNSANLPQETPVVVSIEATPGPQPLLPIETDFLSAHNTQAIAASAINDAHTFIAQLGDLVANLSAPSVTANFPSIPSAPAITAPTAPNLLPSSFSAPNVPAAFSAQVPGVTSFPLFVSTPPTLLFPNAPQAPNPVLPNVPAVDLNFKYPTVDVELPPVPDLLSIDVQKFDGVTFPTLSATAPVLTAVAPSVVSFVPNAPYTDALLTTMTTTLKQRLDIGNTGTNTGLPPAVEQNIWNRERERELKSQADNLTKLDKMESMGYAFPPGTFTDARIKILTETNAVLVGSSRDIAVAQAKLEQDNIKMALDSGIALEGKLIDYANQTEQRRFEATKYATEAGVAIYNSQVQAYSALVQAYRAAIDVYTAQINGARAEVEIYQAEIAAEKLKVEVNTALIEQYKVRVDAALASIRVFEGEISLIKTQAEVEQIKVSIFGEEIRAYATQAQLYASEIEGYKALISAENEKEQVYATSANVYSTLVQATAKQIDSQLDIYKAQLAAKTQEVEVFKAEVQAESERVRAIAAQNTSVAQIYSATVQGTSTYNEALIKEYQASVDISEKVAQIGVAAAEANGKLYIATAQVAADAAKVGAQVEAQIAASALGAVTYATHRARQDSVGYSQSVSFSQSKGVSQGSNVNSGTTTNVGYSTSTSLSTQVSTSTSQSTGINVAEAQ